MITILYVVVACILTPYLMEWINRDRVGNDHIFNIVKGWPAYAITVIVCTVFGLIVCVLPFGSGLSIANWFLTTAVIFFGNQFVFQTFIKVWAKYRKDPDVSEGSLQ